MGTLSSNMGWFGILSGQRAALSKLEDEVRDNKCCLILGGAGKVERIVSIAALYVQRHDGCVLAHLGDVDDEGHLAPCCKLPGSKVAHGEGPEAAIGRMLNGLLSCIAEFISFEEARVETETATSRRTSVQTKYIRIVHVGSWLESEMASLVYVSLKESPYREKQVHFGSIDDRDKHAGRGSTEGDGREQRDSFLVVDNGQCALLGWLSPASFTFYHQATNGKHLNDWLGDQHVPV